MDNFRPCPSDPRILTTSDVVNASSVIMMHSHLPRRVVLRHQPGSVQEWVVHVETLTFARRDGNELLVHRSFENGNYFSDEQRARVRFCERQRHL